MRELFEVQKRHADALTEIIENHHAALDGSITGAGKTLVAAEIAAYNQPPTFVVCPKSAIPMWELELKDRGVKDILGVVNYEMFRTGKTRWGTWAGSTTWQWKNLPSDALIIWDEVQRCQGMNTLNARMLWSAKSYYNLCLSATAAEDPTDLKALGYLLGLHDLRGFWNWTKMHGCKPGFYGGMEFTGQDEDIDRLHKVIFPKHGSRLTYLDMAPFFKDTEIITTPLDFGAEITKIYADMSGELAELADKVHDDGTGAEALTIRLRARQKAELLKVPEILSRIPDLLKESLSVVVFVNFDASAEAIREKLKVPCGMITGRHVKNRQRYIDDFQADVLRVMICNVAAGGVSVSLHDTHGKHPRVSLISPSDNAKDVLQLLGRIHRAGGMTLTRQFILFAAGTIEEEVKANCDDKIKHIGIFNEGLDVGTAIAED